MDKEKERLQKKYNDYVKQVTPTHNLWWNMAKAFVTGGIICCIGQFILNVCVNYGLDQKTSGSWCSMCISAVCTAHRSESVPFDCKLGGRGRAGANYRVCKRCGRARHRVSERGPGLRNWLQDLYDCRTGHFIRNIFKLGARIDLLGIKMVGNGVVPFPCGSGRGKTFSQTRNIVIFGSEERKNTVPDPAPGEIKRNGSGREKHGFRPRNPENSRKSDAQSCRRLRDMLWSRTW